MLRPSRAALAATVSLALTAIPAAAAHVNIVGTPGAGNVTISLSGTITANGAGGFQPTSFASFDGLAGGDADLEFFDYIADAGLQDTVFDTEFTSNTLAVSFGGTNVGIDGLFMDDDAHVDGNDDFGFRVNQAVAWTKGQELTFSGNAVLPYDISAFQVSTLVSNVFDSSTLALEGSVSLSVQAVPLPAALPALALGLCALGSLRRRRG